MADAPEALDRLLRVLRPTNGRLAAQARMTRDVLGTDLCGGSVPG